MKAALGLRLAATALLGGAMTLLASAPAQADPVWVEGAFQETNILSCIQLIPENGTGAYLAYQEPAPSTPPRVGEVYYVAVVVAGLGNNCAGTIYSPQVRLPAGTEPAVSGENPVYCFASPAPNQPMQPVSGMCAGIEAVPGGSLQIDSTSTWAGEFEGTPIAPSFPIAEGYFEEENFPVVSTTPLSGGERIESDIYTTDAGGQHLYPWVAPVVVAGEEGAGGATGGGSPGGGSPGGGAPGGDSGGAGGGASAGGSGGGKHPTPGVPSPKLARPKVNASKRAATFAFRALAGAGSTRFRCSLDTAPFKPCRSPKTYRGLKTGGHAFRVEAFAASVTSAPTKVRFRIRGRPGRRAATRRAYAR